jgi:hypothetical protein
MSENRILVSVSVRRNAVAEVVGRQPGPEKRESVSHAKSWDRAMHGDGDLARGNLGYAKVWQGSRG